ncbi:ionotropic receptor 93a [Leptopilina boulardi]|uniref:ionotropic receptor 93a n=1 Tax=Leptopilina boulardi TaxID=63433 RepID=UPI0021F5E5CA|nr:ionotropic receptor 93a [Leptopilina boulardi]
MTQKMISLLFLLFIVDIVNSYNDYPSLITSNATMAVIVEKNFLKDDGHYEKVVSKITNTINNVISKWMKVGGIDVKVYSISSFTLGRDFTILMSIATCQWTWVLFKQARKERLVHIAVTGADCPRLPDQEGISIPLIMPGQELPQLFLDLRVSGALSWNKINIIYDTSFQRDTISKVLKSLSIQLPNKKLKQASRSLFSIKYDKDDHIMRNQIRKTFSNYRFEKLGNCFMVIVKVDMVIPIIEMARSLRLVHSGNQWLFILSDVSKRKTNVTALTQRLIEGENVAFIYNATNFGPFCDSGLFCHLKELIKSLSLALEISYQSELDLFSRVTDEEFEVLRLSKEERAKEITENLNKALTVERSTSDGNCGKCLTWRIGSAITWGNSFDSILAGRGQLIHSGSWSPGPGSNLTDSIFPHIDYGFRGKTLPIITYHNPPWQIVEYSTNGVPNYEGLTFDIVEELSKKLNFTYQVILATSSGTTKAANNIRSLGFSKRLSDNSSYEGSGMSVGQKLPESVLQMLRNNKVFFAACVYTVYEDKKKIINYTVPISMQTYTLLAPKPKILSRALLFIAPFTNETWACLSSTIIVIGLILYLMHKFNPKPTINAQEVVGLNTPYQCVWYVYGALLQQGGMHLPQEDSTRLIVGTWWLGVMVIVATYSGSLVAFLTFPRMDNTVSTIDDLLERKSEFTWGFPNGSFLEDYLENTEDSKYLELLTKAERHISTSDINIISRVQNGNHVLIDWKSSFKYLIRKDILESGRCHFSLSTEDFISEPIAMMISKDSPYLPIINKELKRLHESGLIDKWILERMPLKDKCWEGPGNNQEANNHKVNMGDMQGIFFVLAIGFIIAAILIGCEFGWHKKEEVHERKLIRPFVT